MLETERYDKEPGNDDGAAAAGHSAEITGNPAEAGPASDATDPGSKDAGTHGRRLFRRGRRAATRPAGPPASDADQAGGDSAAPAGSGEPGDAAAAPQDSAPQDSAPTGLRATGRRPAGFGAARGPLAGHRLAGLSFGRVWLGGVRFAGVRRADGRGPNPA